MSTKEKVLGDWNQLKGKVKQHWGQLTDDELSEVEGNIDQLVGLVQQKTGEARQNIEKALTKMSQDAGGTISQATEVAREYANQASEALRGRAVTTYANRGCSIMRTHRRWFDAARPRLWQWRSARGSWLVS